MDNRGLWRMRLKPYIARSNYIALFQVANTLVPFLLVWALFLTADTRQTLLFFPCIVILTILLLQSFIHMHDCGHGSLFRTVRSVWIY